MKRRLLVLPLTVVLGALVVSSYSSGPFRSGSLNRTGSAGAGTANCAGGGCHPNNSATTTVTIRVTNSSGDAVTSWTPGATYTVHIDGRNTNGLSRFGFQSTAVRASAISTQAGTFSAIGQIAVRTGTSPNIVEHDAMLTGTVSGTTASHTAIYTWIAPAAGAGTVRFLATLNAVNANGATSGDEPQTATPVDLTEASGTNVSGVSAAQIRAYPNPAAGELSLELPEAFASGSYLIRDVRGSVVRNGAIRGHQGHASLNVATLAAGAYFVQVRSGNSSLVAPFVKQ